MFDQSYYTAMDRDYYMTPLPEKSGYMSGSYGVGDNAPDITLPLSDIGVSAHPGQDQLQALNMRIRQGAGKVELGFFGTGKGNEQNRTPEMYGKNERQAIRELAQVNEVELSTHASPNAGSLAGWGQRGFDEQVRERTLHEIERAIDFAADATNGGAIVVHANEFPRSIQNRFGVNGEEKKFAFRGFEGEAKEGYLQMVDKLTGAVTGISKRQLLHVPKYEEKEVNGKDYWVTTELEDDGTPQLLEKTFLAPEDKNLSKEENDAMRDRWERLRFLRIPKYEPDLAKSKGKRFESEELKWEIIQKETAKHNATAKKEITEGELFLRIHKENEIARASGTAWQFSRDLKEHEKKMRELNEKHHKLKKLKEENPGAYAKINLGHEDLIEQTKKELDVRKQEVVTAAEYAGASQIQAENLRQEQKNVSTLEDYGQGKAADTVARAAIYTMQRKEQAERERKEKLKDMFIAVENLFPDQYGGHPEEVAEIVLAARKTFEDKLRKDHHKSKEEAEDLAKRYIKATWDTGHANIWFKYFDEKAGETLEAKQARFKKWYLEQARMWKEKEIMGHVHITDNFGWEDEHVPPGEGTTPIKEFLKEIEDNIKDKKTDLIVEPSHHDWRALTSGMRLLGGNIYGLPAGKIDTWADIQHSYFGRNAAPYFLYGDSTTDPNSWQLWSQAPLE